MSAQNQEQKMEMEMMEGKIKELLNKQEKVSVLIVKNLNERKNISLIANLIDRLEELMIDQMSIYWKYNQLNGGNNEDFNIVLISTQSVLDAFRKRMLVFLDYLEAHEEELEKEMTLAGCSCSCSRPCDCA